jgi:hypothetical protein
MPQQPSPSPEVVLRNYFHAKDENRPHLLDSVFTSAASLQVHNSSSSIALPAVTHGREAIADVLVRQFNRTYENIYSFYLSRPPETAQSFSCAWLVGMTEKDNKSVRVGCGTYEWTFSSEPPHLANALVININAMLALPPSCAATVLPWLLQLSYPWCSSAQASALAPSMRELAHVLQFLRLQ